MVSDKVGGKHIICIPYYLYLQIVFIPVMLTNDSAQPAWHLPCQGFTCLCHNTVCHIGTLPSPRIIRLWLSFDVAKIAACMHVRAPHSNSTWFTIGAQFHSTRPVWSASFPGDGANGLFSSELMHHSIRCSAPDEMESTNIHCHIVRICFHSSKNQ